MKKILLAIGGMSCSACSNGLEKYLKKQEGIIEASVNLVMANAFISYDENLLNQEKIEKFIQEAGFESLGIYEEKEEKKKNQKQTRTFWIFTLFAVFFLYVSMGHMIGLPSVIFLSPKLNPVRICMVFVGSDTSFSLVWKRHFRKWMEKSYSQST